MQNNGNERNFSSVRAERTDARAPGAGPSTGAARTERKKLSLKFGS